MRSTSFSISDDKASFIKRILLFNNTTFYINRKRTTATILTMQETKQEQTVKPVVNIKNLNFSYDKGVPNIVGLNCVIQPNSKVVLVGANGAGKSTLLRILTGQIFMNLDSEEFDGKFVGLSLLS